jgi:hypothetical protein
MEGRVEGWRDHRHAHALDAVADAQGAREGVERRDVFHLARVLAVVDEELGGDGELLGEIGPGRGRDDRDQSLGVAIGKGIEQHLVEHRVDGGEKADGQPERADDGRRKGRRPAQCPSAMAQVARPSLKDSAHGPAPLQSVVNGRPCRPPALGERRAHEVDPAADGRPRAGEPSARACAVEVDRRVLGHGLPEPPSEGLREQANQPGQRGLHGREVPSRFTARVAACRSRAASSASARRPAAVSV